jgi:hypothetical protein
MAEISFFAAAGVAAISELSAGQDKGCPSEHGEHKELWVGRDRFQSSYWLQLILSPFD